jgi:LAO/AO transport system kinase
MPHKDYKSALTVNPGIEPLPSINQESAKKFKARKRKLMSADEYADGILSQNIPMLSQAITLVESSLPEHHILGQQVIEKCLPYSGNSIRIGITGVPGVGKSSFIEALGNNITSSGRKLAVLAIDPSSERSKGSILGDKTRMETLSSNVNAFIRPSPSAGSLGGVARKTRESIILCEAAGFNTIFIETVGVGQSETAVHSMVDFFLLLMLAGAGDELQGIKRGIMEMADLIAITKADGDNIKKSQVAKAEYESALHLFPPAESGWYSPVRTCSSREMAGINEVWNEILNYVDFTKSNGFFFNRRRNQSKYWMYEAINEALKNSFYNSKDIQKHIPLIESKVLDETVSSFTAAKELLDRYFNKENKG